MGAPPVILGTAGHIDHGKSALIKALTGINPDRLKEEQQRGITIELGFAHLTVGEQHFGVVDVPGHERFIKSMVAGAGGIDLVILVVAADEGVMPQTREHLDICQLLGVQRGLLALTKTDLVEPDWLELVEDDLQQFLQGTFLEGAAVVPCSAQTGAGLNTLKEHLALLASSIQPRDPHGLLRLPLDRVFTIKGFGTVVTGTLLSGTLQVGQEVMVLPGDITGKVRGIQVHGEAVEQAQAGQRTAVNIGGVDRHAVARGEVLVHPDTLAPSSMIDAEVHLLPSLRKPLPRRSKVLFHLGTRQQEGTCVLLNKPQLEPGEEAIAQLRFELPVVALPEDRFILRGFRKLENYGTTVGGGKILRVLSRKMRPRDHEAIALLQEAATAPTLQRLALEILAAGPPGISRLQLRQRLPLLPEELDRLLNQLLNQKLILRFDKESGAVVHMEHVRSLLDQIRAIVDTFHREQALEAGISREELRSRLGSGVSPRLFFALLQALEKGGDLEVEREICYRPGHTQKRGSHTIRPLAEKIGALYKDARLGPPRDATLAEQLDADPQSVADAIKLLVDEQTLVKVSALFFHRPALEDLEGRLVAFLEAEGEIAAAQFKELVGQSRKFTIPLAEHFDAQRVTLRVGDLRKLRR